MDGNSRISNMHISTCVHILVSVILCSASADTTVTPVEITNEDINTVDYKQQTSNEIAKQVTNIY